MRSLYFFLFTFCWIILQTAAVAQCDVGADAGPDIEVCIDATTTNLNGSVSGSGVLGFSWSPTFGLSDPNSLTPTVFLDGTSRTYTLTSQGFDDVNNQIVNGDFSMGDTGFDSDYDLGTGGAFGLLSAEGQYAISNNAANTHTNFAGCSDHTGGGNMMVVNGSSIAGEEIWCQTVTVTPGTDYAFSAWVTSVISSNPARLQFSINGILVGSTFVVSSATCSWQEFNELWTASSSTAEICITNQNTAGSGNDFALDDLFFGEVCEDTDEVNISVIDITADAPLTLEIPCDGMLQIDGSNSTQGPNIFYNWSTTDGNIVSGFGSTVINVNLPGTYRLQVLFDDGVTACIDETIITVTDDLPTAVAVASALGVVSCSMPTVSLSGAGSSSGPGWTYFWTTPDGNIVSGASSLNPVVDAGGTYELVVFNPTSGCTAIEEVVVQEDLTPPGAGIAPPLGIPCGANGITLDGTPSSTGPTISYAWSTTDGMINSGANGTNPFVASAGTYQLIVTEASNGCSDTASVVVTEAPNSLLVAIASPDTIRCLPTPVTLDASGSSTGADVTYSWTTTTGNIISGTTDATPAVDQPGTYLLTIEDTGSGCTRTDSVRVVEDLSPPALSFNLPDTITCSRDTALLLAFSTAAATYSWTTNTGSILSGQNTDSLIVATAGDYFLTVEDQTTGCTSTDTIAVAEQLAPPLADAGAPFTITCGTGAAMLDGSNSSSGPGFAYQWTTTSGTIVMGAQTQVPSVDAAGVYYLEVTNTATGCTAIDSVVVASNDQAPNVALDVNGDLDCNITVLEIDGSASDSGGDIIFNWTTTDGNFSGGMSTLRPEVDAGGTYTLTVTDTVTNCQTIQSVTIAQDTVHPVVAVGPTFRLDCRQPIDTLSSLGSATGVNFSYAWSTPDGNILSGASGPAPAIDAAGTYVLEIVNTMNGCRTTDSVSITESFALPTVAVGPDQTLNCRDTLLTLGENAADPAFVFAWSTTNGQILTGEDTNEITVRNAGDYRLQITDTDNGCVNQDSVTILQDQTLPTLTVALPATLNCGLPLFDLDATGSSIGTDFLIDWSTTNGNVLAGANGLTPTIDTPGAYTLLIRDVSNFCRDSVTVTVAGDFVLPVVEAGDTLRINCRNPEINLSSAGSDTGGNLSLIWSTTTGNFVGDPTTANPLVDAPGSYLLTLINEDNNCTASDSVVVDGDFMLPIINGGPNVTLTCAEPELALGLDPVRPGYQYFWTTFSGNITGGGNTPQATVDRPGLYTLRVVNQGNGCRNADNVTVGIDTIAPMISIPTPGVLNCRDTEVALEGQAPAGLQYRWTTVGGAFATATDQVATVAVAPGDYQLEVTDPDNGCRSAATVSITQNIAPPVFSIAPAAALTCLTTEQTLQATNLGPDFLYAWSSSDGNILVGADGPSPEVDSAGTYVLTIMDTRNFCTAMDSLRVIRDVDFPSLSVASPATLTCTVTTVDLVATTNLSSSVAEVSWTSPDGNLISGAASLMAVADAPGSYQLMVGNPDNGCVSTATVEVEENVVVPTIDLAEMVDLGCTEADFSLNAAAVGNGPLAYQWSTSDGRIVAGVGSLAPIINGIGTYTLRVTDTENGCVDSAAVFADQNLLLDFAFTQRPPNCEFLEGTLFFGDIDGGTQPFSYSIDGGASFQNDPVFQGLAPDNYVMVVRDGNGCEVERGTTIVPAPEFELAVSENALIDFGDFYQIDARINFPLDQVDTIIWTPTIGLDCTNCLNPRAMPPETQSYRLRVETLDGCSAEGFLTIIVNEENPVYFPTAFSPNGDGVNDFFIPFASLTRVARITSMQIFDRWGESVFFNEDFAPNDEQEGWDGTLDGRPLNPQVLVYAVEVEFLNGETRLFKGDFALMR